MSEELERLSEALSGVAPAGLVRELVRAAEVQGARRLFDTLDAEGRVEPCGQGCGWEGPWAIDTTLWPVDRERLLGTDFVAQAQSAEAEEQLRLLGSKRE